MTAVGMMPHIKMFKVSSRMTTGVVTQQSIALLRYRSAETRRHIWGKTIIQKEKQTYIKFLDITLSSKEEHLKTKNKIKK